MAAIAAATVSCAMKIDTPETVNQDPSKKQVTFPVNVTRDGQAIPTGAITKGGNGDNAVTDADMIATMNKDIPFGIVGIDLESKELILDNEAVYTNGGQYKGFFDAGLWYLPFTITLSAYYPYVNNVVYGEELDTYSIPFTSAETDAGPLISKTVQCAVSEMNMVPLEFRHITNDIGFKICDVTTDPNLQGLIHLRKVTSTYVASAGIFVNDIELGNGYWHRRGYYRDVVVFEGDAKVGVGMENELFIGKDKLVSRLAESHRYYGIPDEIQMGKQTVEVLYDVESFTLNGFTYPAIKDQTAHYMLYGVLPDNIFVYGKQYTFHLGLDTGKLYPEITFAASVSGWETKIYEQNDEF